MQNSQSAGGGDGVRFLIAADGSLIPTDPIPRSGGATEEQEEQEEEVETTRSAGFKNNDYFLNRRRLEAEADKARAAAAIEANLIELEKAALDRRVASVRRREAEEKRKDAEDEYEEQVVRKMRQDQQEGKAPSREIIDAALNALVEEEKENGASEEESEEEDVESEAEDVESEAEEEEEKIEADIEDGLLAWPEAAARARGSPRRSPARAVVPALVPSAIAPGRRSPARRKPISDAEFQLMMNEAKVRGRLEKSRMAAVAAIAPSSVLAAPARSSPGRVPAPAPLEGPFSGSALRSPPRGQTPMLPFGAKPVPPARSPPRSSPRADEEDDEEEEEKKRKVHEHEHGKKRMTRLFKDRGGGRIEYRAMITLLQIQEVLTNQIAEAAIELVRDINTTQKHPKTVTWRDVSFAVTRLFPVKLARHMIAQGSRRTNRYMDSGAGDKSDRHTMEKRTRGMVLSPRLASNVLRDGYKFDVSPKAAVFLTAAVEGALVDLIELATARLESSRYTTMSVNVIRAAVLTDEDWEAVLGNSTFYEERGDLAANKQSKRKELYEIDELVGVGRPELPDLPGEKPTKVKATKRKRRAPSASPSTKKKKLTVKKPAAKKKKTVKKPAKKLTVKKPTAKKTTAAAAAAAKKKKAAAAAAKKKKLTVKKPAKKKPTTVKTKKTKTAAATKKKKKAASPKRRTSTSYGPALAS